MWGWSQEAGTTNCLEGAGIVFALFFPFFCRWGVCMLWEDLAISYRRDVIWARSSASAVVCIMGQLPKRVQGGSAGLAPLCLPYGNPSSGKNTSTEVVPICFRDSGSIHIASHRRRQTVDAKKWFGTF
ncbi:unnamed protein product [Prunus armeniaca]